MLVHVNAAPPHRQDKNGLAERHWQTLVSMARNWLVSADLPPSFWYYAVKRASEVCNYFPFKLEDNPFSTPFELAHHTKPDLRALFKPFCLAAVRRERLGDDVRLIVLDNAVDVTLEGQDEWGGLRTLMRELKWWARETGAAVVVCHHTSEGVQGNPCPPRHALHGKVAQTPSLILTVHSQQGVMGVCAVKNRYGPADATGGTPIWLSYDPASMQILDLQQHQVQIGQPQLL